jgi:hypothetical protein
MTTKKLTKKQQEQALGLVAAWLGPRMGYDGPAPTGPDASARALGPNLAPDWDWPSSGPTPTLLLEGGPFDWAVDASLDDDLVGELKKIGVFAEPYAGYALCLYPY